jgi:hypothetical protein
MTTMAVNVLAASALCVLAVTLALLVPDLSWAAVPEALTSQPPCRMVEQLQ